MSHEILLLKTRKENLKRKAKDEIKWKYEYVISEKKEKNFVIISLEAKTVFHLLPFRFNYRTLVSLIVTYYKDFSMAILLLKKIKSKFRVWHPSPSFTHRVYCVKRYTLYSVRVKYVWDNNPPSFRPRWFTVVHICTLYSRALIKLSVWRLQGLYRAIVAVQNT